MSNRSTRILRKPEVRERTGLSDPTIFRKESAGEFPRRVCLGARSVGWLESEIEDWIASRAADRTDPKSPKDN